MLNIENIEITGWKAAIRGMRNPMNSWSKSDTVVDREGHIGVGDNDLDLMKRLARSGEDHSKYLRMINITMDITAPLYWWKEFDTYKVGTVANSCSTMHKLMDQPFNIFDFSVDTELGMQYLNQWIVILNDLRDDYIMAKHKNDEVKARERWRETIQLLPECYNQKRTVQLNYAVARRIYEARKNHKLSEWHTLCDIFKKLPYFNELFIEE